MRQKDNKKSDIVEMGDFNKLDMQSKDIVDSNIKKIGQLFPNVIIQTNEGEKIDYDLLKQELSSELIDSHKERYQLNWPGKKEAILTSNTIINKTLRPVKERSIDFENSKNIYIEGDNLETLKILQESYLNSIDCIYIDPPYNTGNDFIYNDKFDKSRIEELRDSGEIDEYNNKLVANNSSNGKFHSDWLSMMYSRIKLSRNILAKTGIIFISIGDDELYNLKCLCDEIFGMNNFIACCTRISKRTSNKGNFFKPTKDYVLVYAKNIDNITWKFGVETKVNKKEFRLEDKNGKYKKNGASLYQPSLDSRPNQRYYIQCPDGSLIIPPGSVFPSELKDGAKVKPLSNNDKCWRWSVETYLNNKDKLIFTPASDNCPLIDSYGNPAKWNVYDKVYLDDKIDETLLPEDVIYDYVNSQGTKELLSLKIKFSFAKPVGLIKYLIKLTQLKNNITVLDFFSGSGTTAQAVMQLNAEDGGSRKYILVQLPEKIEDDKFNNICELAQTRIKRAAKKIKEETNANIDYGYRVYKVDSSNMKDVYYEPSKLAQMQLSFLESNIKEDRTDEDLLTQVILDLGLTLDLDIEERKILNNKVYFVEDNKLVACFDDKIQIEFIDEICKEKPLKIVFRENAFDNDNDKINIYERIKSLSDKTEIKVI